MALFRSLLYRSALVAAGVALAGCAQNAAPSCDSQADAAYPTPRNLCRPLSDAGALATLTPPAFVSAIPSAAEAAAAPSASASAAGKPGKLPLREALYRVVGDSPDVGIAAAREREQYAAIRGASAARWPTIDLTAAAGPQHNWESVPPGTGIRREAGLGVRQTLFDFGATDSNEKRAQLAYDSATQARIAKTEQTAYDMLDILLKVQQIDETAASTRRSIAAHEAILAIVKSNEQDGNSTVADTKRVTTRLEAARTALIDLMTDRAAAADAFRRLTDMAVDSIVDTVTPSIRRDVARVDESEVDANPDIRAIVSEIAALKEQLQALQRGTYPTIALEGNYKIGRQMSDPFESDRREYANALVSLRIPLADGGVSLSQREQARARLEAAELKLEKRRRELREEARGAARVFEADRSKTGSLDERLAASRKVAELYMIQFKEGGRTIFELLDAQVDLNKAETEMISQKFTRLRARIKALYVAGELVARIERTTRG